MGVMGIIMDVAPWMGWLQVNMVRQPEDGGRYEVLQQWMYMLILVTW